MTPDLAQRLANALDEMQGLGAREAENYLNNLRARDPELAGRLGTLLNFPDDGSSEPTGLAEPVPSSVVPLVAEFPEPLSSRDARATASFHPPAARSRPETPVAPDGGQFLNRYRIVRALGRGAFGDVWLALDTMLEKQVAVKVARPDRTTPGTAFLDEARKAASLPKHPAIVHIYDVCASGDEWFIVSEFIDGESLRTRLETGSLSREHAVRVVATIAGALHAAHLAGLVHRDVKPANILLDRTGRAYLTDFGLAVREEDQFAERSKVSGTLAYMPPEQINGDTHLLDGRADIYALGAVLYELLTGRVVFRGSDVEEYRELILRREPRPPRAIDASVPAELERICLKCLAKEVKDRYRTAQDLATDLEAWLEESTRSFTLPAPVGQPRGQWMWAVGGVLALALVVATVAVLQIGGKSQPTDPSPANTAPVAGQPPAVVPGVLRKVPAVKELLWTRSNPRNEWKVLADTNELKVYTVEAALLQVGQTDATDWTFTATFKQLQPVGGIGLFLGYRRDEQQQLATFELLTLVAFGEQLNLQRCLCQHPLGGRVMTPTVAIPGPALQLRVENTLRITVRNGALSAVHFNGEAVPEVLRGGSMDHPASAGGFGVYNKKSDGTYSHLLLNDDPIWLLVDPLSTERP